MSQTPIGTFCLVLHTHLPWLAHHGSWPVGEEWLYQAWGSSYIPVVDTLERLAEQGHRDLLTLGMTPILNAQLDDPYCLREAHTWLGDWQLRAAGAATRREPHIREVASYEYGLARRALELFEGRWRNGGTPVLRGLADSGAVEILGGPAAHPFQPLLTDRMLGFSLRAGLRDGASRFGVQRKGIWAPECGYRPGMEDGYAATGVSHLMVDGPTLQGVGRSTAAAYTIGSSPVVAFGRDLEVTYRVWSPKRGYPGGAWYRDFHTYDHASGLRPVRVTSTTTPSHEKAPYDPDRARQAVERDAIDFVNVVRARLEERAAQRGRPGLVVAGYDTELYGHWWHEGPLWLERILTLLPEAGVRVTTFGGAIDAGHVEGTVEPGAGSWGSGKDWRVWDGAAVADIVEENTRLQNRVTAAVDAELAVAGRATRHPALDQLCRQLLLALESDWAFMVSKDSAVGYARDRFRDHAAATDRLCGMVEAATSLSGALRAEALRAASREAARQRRTDGPLGHIDARDL